MELVRVGNTRVFRWETTGPTTKTYPSGLNLILLGVSVSGFVWLFIVLATSYGLDDLVLYWQG